MALARGPADVIVASCGLDHVPLRWVRLLNDGGRLMIPLTTTLDEWPGGGSGREPDGDAPGRRFAAELIGGVGIYTA